jgi:hypothetical protein
MQLPLMGKVSKSTFWLIGLMAVLSELAVATDFVLLKVRLVSLEMELLE